MRIIGSVILTFLCSLSFAQDKEQPLKNLFNEFHASVNHPLGNGFFGGGLGANHVFRSDKIFAFRTGLEFQFFKVWGGSGPPSYYSSTKDVRFKYVDFTIPVALRINIKWVFIELGANLGVGVAGQRSATVTSYYDYQPAVVKSTKESWNSGPFVGYVFGIGTLIPVNEKLDLLIRPDVGANVYFKEEFGNAYGRLCIGIHLK